MRHVWKFMSGHGVDAPGQSLDTYEQCSECGLVKHDYRHGGGQRSPNYPLYLVGGVNSVTEPECVPVPCASLPPHDGRSPKIGPER